MPRRGNGFAIITVKGKGPEKPKLLIFCSSRAVSDVLAAAEERNSAWAKSVEDWSQSLFPADAGELSEARRAGVEGSLPMGMVPWVDAALPGTASSAQGWWKGGDRFYLISDKLNFIYTTEKGKCLLL